jgi:uncharacterized protein YyaL (SSP411 family)
VGVLEDQARVLAAFTRAVQVFGGDAYLETARAVADRTLELVDEAAFRDGRLDGPGLCSRPLYPLDGNVEAADGLVDLAVLSGEDRYREAARAAVGAFAGATERMGVHVAGYGSVAARLCRRPLVVAVGGPAGSDLHRAALRVADHEKVVRPGDPDVPAGRAAVVGADADPVDAPEDLMAQVSAWTGGDTDRSPVG